MGITSSSGIPRDPEIDKIVYVRLLAIGVAVLVYLAGYFLTRVPIIGLEVYVATAVLAYGTRTAYLFIRHMKVSSRMSWFFLFSSGYGLYAFLVVLVAYGVTVVR